jgi:hypothetical protein
LIVVVLGAAGLLNVIFWLPALSASFVEAATEPELVLAFETEFDDWTWPWVWELVWELV